MPVGRIRFKPPWDRGGLRTYLLLIAVIACQVSVRPILYGLPLLLLGLALQVYSKGCLQQNVVVATGGPYRFVRHPFYVANFLIDGGIAVMSGWWPLLVLFPVWWLAVYLPVMAGEERHLSQLFPDLYPDYLARLPRLLPVRRPLPSGGEPFSWRNPNLISDTVFPRVLRMLSYPVLFLWAHEIKRRDLSFLAAGHGLELALLLTPVVLHGLARELDRHLRKRRANLPPVFLRPAFRAVLVVAFLALALGLRCAETEAHVPAEVLGGFLLAASLPLYFGRTWTRLAAEGLGLAGVAVLCQVPWLAALPLLMYAALALDARLREAQPHAAGPDLPARPAFVSLYGLAVLGGLLAAVAKARFLG